MTQAGAMKVYLPIMRIMGGCRFELFWGRWRLAIWPSRKLSNILWHCYGYQGRSGLCQWELLHRTRRSRCCWKYKTMSSSTAWWKDFCSTCEFAIIFLGFCNQLSFSDLLHNTLLLWKRYDYAHHWNTSCVLQDDAHLEWQWYMDHLLKSKCLV